MFDPQTVTLGQVTSAARDFSIVLAIFTGGITAAWKGRGLFEAAKGFFDRFSKHMDTMENGMETLLSNHLKHIEDDLKTVASHQVRVAVQPHVMYVAANETVEAGKEDAIRL